MLEGGNESPNRFVSAHCGGTRPLAVFFHLKEEEQPAFFLFSFLTFRRRILFKKKKKKKIPFFLATSRTNVYTKPVARRTCTTLDVLLSCSSFQTVYVCDCVCVYWVRSTTIFEFTTIQFHHTIHPLGP